MNRREFLCGALAAAALGSGRMTWAGPAAGKRWYRGNLHTHTLVSDGQAFPVEAALLYKRFGYDFLMLSDHNAVHDRELWITEKNHHRRSFFETHARRFAAEYPAYRPQTRTEADGTTAWRYGAFEETAAAVNEPGRFLLMSGCEYHNEVRTGEQLHCLGINVRQGHRAIFPNSLEESMAEMLKEHLRKNDGRKSIFVVNHPLYWLYDVAPTLLSEHDEITHFEVANWDSRPEVRLPGGYDEDKLWDYALARRCLRGGPLLYGLATDDQHCYTDFYTELSGGKKRFAGWVMVRSDRLETDALVAALRAGDFYSSTGVYLDDVRFENGTLSVRVRPEKGARYAIRFLGTKRSADLSSFSPGVDEDALEILKRAGASRKTMPTWLGKRRRIAHIPEAAGVVLKEVQGCEASYRLCDDDLYVRAKIVRLGTKEAAWTQPHVAS